MPETVLPCGTCGHSKTLHRGGTEYCVHLIESSNHHDWCSCAAFCACLVIKDGMADGHPNPEGAEEWRNAHGHYAACSCGRVNRRAAAEQAEPSDYTRPGVLNARLGL